MVAPKATSLRIARILHDAGIEAVVSLRDYGEYVVGIECGGQRAVIRVADWTRR